MPRLVTLWVSRIVPLKVLYGSAPENVMEPSVGFRTKLVFWSDPNVELSAWKLKLKLPPLQFGRTMIV